jgi:DNA-binding response OmpR family regulator
VSRPSILVVEDDRTLREGLRTALATEGFAVDTAADGHTAEAALARGGLDLVVLDLMLPGPNGLELLRAFRRRDAGTPVVILTARGDESDKVLGLELGADDYVTKPFGLRELLARVRAQLRRRALARETPRPAPFTLGDAEVDLAAFRVRRGVEELGLSPKEAAILELLRLADGKAVHRHQLLDRVWGSDVYVGTRTIDTHVLNLRQKIEVDPRRPRHLLTVHGIGYRLVFGPDASTGS